MATKGSIIQLDDLSFREQDATIADIILTVGPDDTVGRVWVADARPLPDSDSWIGRRLADLLSGASHGHFLRARKHLHSGNPSRARAQLELPLDNGGTLIVAAQLEETKKGLRLICLDQTALQDAVSRADRLQLALEAVNAEDRLETGLHRALLSHLDDAIVIVDATTGRILDLSKPAVAVLAVSADIASSLSSGTAFTQCFEGRRRSEFIESLCSAATANRTLTAELRSGRGEVTVRPRLARANDALILICDLTFSEKDGRVDGPAGFTALAQNSPDGMVCVDESGTITKANAAFAQMLAAPSENTLDGRGITGFLLRGAIDLKAMTDPRRPATFTTQIVGLTGQRTPVEVSISTLPDGGHGLTLRDITVAQATRSMPEVVAPEGAARPTADPARQVGTVPLRDIVAGMTDVIERDCVEAAIALTQNNRVAAAEMLGLSRQSLYVKLRKFGLLDNKGE